MTSLAAEIEANPETFRGVRPMVEGAESLWLAGCVVVALLAALPALTAGWRIWSTDPLRSFGMLFPLAAVVFLVRGVLQFRGPWKGTLWGLAPVAAAVALILFREHRELLFTFQGHFELDLLPKGVALSLLCAGLLLLAGGVALLRGLLFPVVLLGITNPVPFSLTMHLDLPLQQASAEAARRFAWLIGEHPTGEQLRLMFTPEFGMFIAPGCDGIRGAVTLGYLALLAAAWKRRTAWVCAGYFAAGLAIGYVFNFLRLFALVLYYKLGESVPSIQPYGTGVDYAIGAAFFLSASYFLGRLVMRREVVAEERPLEMVRWRSGLHLRLALFVAMCALPAVLNVDALVRQSRAQRRPEHPADRLPEAVGRYRLVQRWDERSEEGIRLYQWARYSNGAAAEDVSLGLWMPPNEHDIRYSHAARGQQLVAGEPITHDLPGVGQVAYAVYAYGDGDEDVLVAALLCRGCGGSPPGIDHRFGPFVMRSVTPTTYFAGQSPRSIVLTHEAPRLMETPAELRHPLEEFAAFLDERQLLLQGR